MSDEQFAKEAVAVFKALSDKTRYEIVRMMLDADEVSCTQITEWSSLSSPALSHHFRVLEHSGLMETRKEGVHMFFRINRAKLDHFLPQFQSVHGDARQEAPV